LAVAKILSSRWKELLNKTDYNLNWKVR
jgi:hypothetical protein